MSSLTHLAAFFAGMLCMFAGAYLALILWSEADRDHMADMRDEAERR